MNTLYKSCLLSVVGLLSEVTLPYDPSSVSRSLCLSRPFKQTGNNKSKSIEGVASSLSERDMLVYRSSYNDYGTPL